MGGLRDTRGCVFRQRAQKTQRLIITNAREQAGLDELLELLGAQLEAARSEWFLPGTAQESFAINSIADNDPSTPGRGQKSLKNVPAGPAQATRITAPADGTILALDPDIPPTRQRVRFTADAAGARWMMDGQPLGAGASVPWLPWPGRHRVTLVNAAGQPLDEPLAEAKA